MSNDMIFTGDPITFNVKSRRNENDVKTDIKKRDVIRDDPTFSRYLREDCDSTAVREYEQSQPTSEEVSKYLGVTHKTSYNKNKNPTSQEEQSVSKTNTFEDREFDFLHSSPLIKRSTSLKPYRQLASTGEEVTSPGTRKSVRFADALGLDLASVRHIADPDEPPVVPISVQRTLDQVQFEDVAFWKIRFPQPMAASADFLRRVADRKVLLESCSVNNRDLRVHGIVRVANIAYDKKVTIRYSENGWNTHTDITARYVTDSNDLVTDRFYFYFNVPGYLGVRNRIEFAIKYDVGGETYWDSNYGYNYTLECIHHLGYE